MEVVLSIAVQGVRIEVFINSRWGVSDCNIW